MRRPLPSNGRPGSADRQPPRLKRGKEPDLDDDYDSDFVASDDDVGEDWHTALRSLTGYDPRKWVPLFFALLNSSQVIARCQSRLILGYCGSSPEQSPHHPGTISPNSAMSLARP